MKPVIEKKCVIVISCITSPSSGYKASSHPKHIKLLYLLMDKLVQQLSKVRVVDFVCLKK